MARSSPATWRVGPLVGSVGAQILSSASNLGVQLGLVLTMEPGPFGSLVVGFAVFYFALALVRGMIGDPLLALGADGGGPVDGDQGRGVNRSHDRLALIAAGSVVGILAVAVLAPGVRVELALLALATPGLLLHDTYRYRGWARGRPSVALALDGTWVAVALALFALAATLDRTGGRAVLVAWCGAGLVATLIGGRLLDRTPAPASTQGSGPVRLDDPAPRTTGASTGATEGARTGSSLSGTQMILAIDANALPPALAAAAGATVSAGLRAATLPFMPITTLVGALRVLALARLRAAAVEGRGRAAALRLASIFGLLALLIGTGTVVGLRALPAAWLGPTGRLVEPWLGPAAVIVGARVVNLPLSDVLSLGPDHRLAIRYRLAASGVTWAATLTGAIVAGVGGAIGGRAVGALASTLLWAAAIVGHGPPSAVPSSRVVAPDQEEPQAPAVSPTS